MSNQSQSGVAYVRQMTDIGTDPIPFELVSAGDGANESRDDATTNHGGWDG